MARPCGQNWSHATPGLPPIDGNRDAAGRRRTPKRTRKRTPSSRQTANHACSSNVEVNGRAQRCKPCSKRDALSSAEQADPDVAPREVVKLNRGSARPGHRDHSPIVECSLFTAESAQFSERRRHSREGSDRRYDALSSLLSTHQGRTIEISGGCAGQRVTKCQPAVSSASVSTNRSNRERTPARHPYVRRENGGSVAPWTSDDQAPGSSLG